MALIASRVSDRSPHQMLPLLMKDPPTILAVLEHMHASRMHGSNVGSVMTGRLFYHRVDPCSYAIPSRQPGA